MHCVSAQESAAPTQRRRTCQLELTSQTKDPHSVKQLSDHNVVCLQFKTAATELLDEDWLKFHGGQ